MASIYRISAITQEGKSKDGTKTYRVCDLVSPEETLLPKVKFWDWKMKDMWDRVVTDGNVEGAIDNDPKWGASFEPHFQGSYNAGFARGGSKGAAQAQVIKNEAIQDFQEKKTEVIQGFQDNKEYGMRLSSTMRDAVLLAIAEGKPTKENVLIWRKWLWDSFGNVTNDKYPYPENNDVPFANDRP